MINSQFEKGDAKQEGETHKKQHGGETGEILS